MDEVNIELKDNLGKSLYLSKKNTHVDPSTISLKTKHALVTFLAKHSPAAPLSWQKVLASVLNTEQKLQQSNTEIYALIAQHILDKKLYITTQPARSVRPASGGAEGGASAGAAMLGAQARDKSSQQEAAPKSDEPSDEGAVACDEPAKSTDESTTGAAPADKTETRGCPISMVSGEELLQITDAQLPGPMPFAWQRTYRSSQTRNIGLGCGWTHTACEHLVLDSATVTYSDSEGRRINFARPHIRQRSKYLLENINLDYINQDTFVLQQRGQWTKVFSRLGDGEVFRLTQLQHKAYQPAKGMRESTGFAINLHYNANNNVVMIAGNWGQSLKAERDNNGRITQIKQVNTHSHQERLLASYKYNEHNDLIAVNNAKGQGEQYRYANHLLQQRTLVTGFSYYYEWDATDTTARCLRNWGDGDIYDYTFEWHPEQNHSRATDSRGYTTEFHYNNIGLIEKEIDPEGGIHQYQYTSGNKTAYINPLGDTTSYFYNGQGLPTGERNALDLRQTTSWFNQNPTVFKDVDGAVWQRAYNTQGLVQSQIMPNGQAVKHTYNKQGLRIKSADASGDATLYHWNNQGLLQSITTTQGITRDFKYDAWGRLTQAHSALGEAQNSVTDNNTDETKATQFQYDQTDNVIALTHPTGAKESYDYNNNDQLVRHSDAQGRITQFEYDGLSQVTKRIDPQGETLHYQYDKERNLIALINENKERYTFEYDGCERLTKEIGFDGREQRYSYNKAGHLIEHLDAGTVKTVFERDALGRMLYKTSQFLEEPTSPPSVVRFAYDPKNRIKETYNASQYIAFHYDVMGRVIKEHHSDLNAKRQRIKASMRDIKFTYTQQGQLTQIQTPDAQNIQYDYGQAGGFNAARYNDQSIAQVQYDLLGRETARLQGERVTQTEYDPSGRLQKQHNLNRQNKTHQPIQREYNYDAFGNISRLLEDDDLTEFNYDLTGKLKKTQRTQKGEQNETFFNFDPAGNLVDITAQKKPKQANITQGNRLAFQGDTKFTYDARGNITEQARGKNAQLKTQFIYNAENQLTKTIQNNQETTYQYDPLGRRISKSDAFGKTDFIWAGDQLLQETRNSQTTTYVFEPQTFKPLAQIIDNQIYHYHLDHLGTPKHLTNHQGDIVWQAQYKTYGQAALKSDNRITNHLRFQGQYFDEETGLHYNRHRYYNPNTGQFTQQDPIGLLGGVNNYQYAPNPVGWVDPLGLKCKEISAAEESASYQGSDPYFGVDPLENISIKKGTKLAHITYRADGVITGNYFTEPGAVEVCRAVDGVVSSKALNQGVQVYAGDGRTEYKKYVQMYEVQEDIPLGGAAFGKTKANPQFNPGRYKTHNQYFIKDDQHSKLVPVSGSLETMKNTEAPDIFNKLSTMRAKKPT